MQHLGSLLPAKFLDPLECPGVTALATEKLTRVCF